MAYRYDFFLGNDLAIELDKYFDVVAGVYLNAATVTATIKNMDDTNVANSGTPLTLAYVSASNGKYRTVIPQNSAPTGSEIKVLFTATEGSDKQYQSLIIVPVTTNRGL